MYRYYLALRFMVSRPINLLGMVGVMLGVWALIVVVSIFSGYIAEVHRHIKMTSADIVVFQLPRRATFDDARKLIMADPNVASCSPRLITGGFVHPRDDDDRTSWVPGALDTSGRFLHLMGIDPVLEAQTTGFGSWLGATEDPQLRAEPTALPTDGDWILVSEQRCKDKHTKRGDELRVSTARAIYGRESSDSVFGEQGLRVAGAFKSTHAGFDSLTGFVGIDLMRTLLSAPNPGFVNEIAVRLKSNSEPALEETRSRIARALNADPMFQMPAPYVLTAGTQEQMFLSSVDHQRGLLKLVLFVIMVVAGFLVYATLSMMVTEKTHDIGVLSALGATRAGVLQVFTTCGFAITLVGTLLGIGTGCITAVYLDAFNSWLKRSFDIDLFPTGIYNLPHVPYELDPLWISIVGGASLAIGGLAAWIPALRAMRRDPLACLRDG